MSGTPKATMLFQSSFKNRLPKRFVLGVISGDAAFDYRLPFFLLPILRRSLQSGQYHLAVRQC